MSGIWATQIILMIVFRWTFLLRLFSPKLFILVWSSLPSFIYHVSVVLYQKLVWLWTFMLCLFSPYCRFYTLMVLSTALFGKPAFRNLICNGLVLAEDGKKMSKRLKNYPSPTEVIDEYGAVSSSPK